MVSANNQKVKFMGKLTTAAVGAPKESDTDYEAEDALRTLTRAEEVKADPHLHGRAKAMAGKKISQMQSIAGKVSSMAKRGLISEKEQARLKGKKPMLKDE